MKREMSRLAGVGLAFLAGAVLSMAAENKPAPIPLRNPAIGESRPAWWLYCWDDNVVVIQGSVEYTKTKADEVKIDISPEALEKHYEKQEDRELQGISSTFFIGNLTVDKVLFAAPGITSTDLNVAAMAAGELKKAKVLLPTLFTRYYGLLVTNIPAGRPKKGVFVLQYGSSVLHIPMVYVDIIPPEQMENAQKVFKRREVADHHVRRAD